MLVGIASVMEESNSFARQLSTVDNFAIEAGPGLLQANSTANTELGGFIRHLHEIGWSSAPLASAWNAAAGPIAPQSFSRLCDLVLGARDLQKCDAVLLALHGAWVCPAFPSADAELVRRLRAALGRNKPIVATIDYHANVTPELVSELDGLVAYRTYPHIDMGDTGTRAARLLERILRERVRPTHYLLRLPLLAAPQSSTTLQQPVADLMSALAKEFEGSALAWSFCCVQPWLDIPDVASSILVSVTDADGDIPRRMRWAAQGLWNRRDEFSVDWVTPEFLVERIRSAPQRPVIVSEAFDGTSAGALGDNPGLLSILHEHCSELAGCVYVVDPEAVTQAWAAGEGGRFQCRVGGKSDGRFGGPVMIDGHVIALSEGSWTFTGPVFTGKKVAMGRSAVVQTGKLTILLSTRGAPMFDPELYVSQGIELRNFDAIGVKSPAMYRAAYAGLGGTALDLDMPGICRGNLNEMPFTNIGRPIFPLDNFSWDAASTDVYSTQERKMVRSQ